MSDCNPDSLRRLDALREHYNGPVILNSAYRSVEHELSKGRSGKSAHTLGRAFDIRCLNSADRFRLVYAALAVGFHRIGIGKNFIHVDDSCEPRHLSNQMWHYY